MSYELAIDPNLVERTLGGNERVLLRFDTASKTLAFYAKQIRFGRITLDGSTPTRIELFDSIRGLYRLHFASAFSRGMHQLRITYVARLQNGSFLQEGMFLVHGPGHQSFFATQMEPVSARTVFPGWDEPLFKARFHISVVVPRDFTAISNMPVESERPSAPYRKIVTFKPTPPMSTYLVALCAGKYAHASIMAGKTRITLYAPPSDVWRALPALRNAREALLYDEHYFSLPYMMPKLDLVVVPGFQNAMENWGVITSGEQLMELDPKRPLQGQEFNIFSTVAHEIAHQWTGDLVTHDAWNDLWLTEGFAEWMQQRASRDLHPKWYQDSQGYFGRMFFLMRDRGREAIRPTGKDRWSISFSPTQYQKAANMIALIEHVVGPRRFRSQLTNYLIAHAYRNASTHDFFNAMNRASPRSLNFIEYPWLYQKGYARIEAIAQPCLNGRRRIILNQPSTQWWPVMLPNDTLVDRKMFTYTTGCAAEPLTDATSYFRVRYAPETLHAFAKSFGRLPSRSRDAIAGDAIAEFEQSPATPQIWQILPKLTLDDDPYLVRQVFWKGADLQSNAAGTSEADKVNEFLRIALGSLGRKILHSSRNDRQMQQSR
ncbi:MAG: hypothetical protein GIW97_08515, partial [Candidatus Eremiobacteraeota bacterium]|nr:hypothetical protein [Candidatus Eremiobacteraeota bacterium]